VWSHTKRSLGNLAVTGVDHLAAIVRNRLKRIQYRPDLLTSFLAHTGLTLDPSHRNRDHSTSVAVADGWIREADNPAAKVEKPRRSPSTAARVASPGSGPGQCLIFLRERRGTPRGGSQCRRR
jgi:hypothetical protein